MAGGQWLVARNCGSATGNWRLATKRSARGRRLFLLGEEVERDGGSA